MEHSDFSPSSLECERHGSYQASFLVAGVVRWLSGCPMCAQEADAHKLLGRAALPPRFEGKTFDQFVCTNPRQNSALALARTYAEKFDEQLEIGRSMIFCGGVGTGKTHLAAAILRTIIAAGHTGLYSTVISAVRSVKETWGGAGRERDVIKGFVRPELLVLDEVGVQFGSEAERLILFEIINGRYEQMRPTILLSNLNVKDVEQNIGPRALDRMREGGGRVVTFDWPSFRPQT